MNINIKKKNIEKLEYNLLKMKKIKFTDDRINKLTNETVELNLRILEDYKKFLYHKKRKKNKISDEKIQKAIDMIEKHKISKKIVAQKYKITVPTLTKYINQKKVKNNGIFDQDKINNLTSEAEPENLEDDLIQYSNSLAMDLKNKMESKRNYRRKTIKTNNIENQSTVVDNSLNINCGLNKIQDE